MDYEVKKLITKGDRIYAEDGEYIGTVSITNKARDLLNNVGRDEGESWIDYRNRTEQERKDEVVKRELLVHDLVTAYNKLMGL
jgi:phosphodiesterase/alkaline phosphatase D-like protein